MGFQDPGFKLFIHIIGFCSVGYGIYNIQANKNSDNEKKKKAGNVMISAVVFWILTFLYFMNFFWGNVETFGERGFGSFIYEAIASLPRGLFYLR